MAEPDAPGSAEAGPDGALPRSLPSLVDRLKSLRCLLAVVRHGSASAASRALHLSQPAVTRAILELERGLDRPLFQRHARGLVATAACGAAAERVARVLGHLQEGAREAVAATAGARVRAGVAERFAATVPGTALRGLLTTADRLDEAAAARALGIGTAALRRGLDGLAHACGVPVLLRHAGRLQITEGGRCLVQRSRLAMAELRAIEADLAAARGEIRGRVVVGVLPGSAHLLLPQAASRLRLQHPGLRLTIVDGTYASLMGQLLAAEVDLVFGGLRPGAPAGLCQETLLTEQLVVMARRGHPCLSPRLDPSQLGRWPWAMPLPDTPAWHALAHLFGQLGQPLPDAALQSSSGQFTRALVLKSDHLALGSAVQAGLEEAAGLIQILPLHLERGTRQVGLTLRQGEPCGPHVQALVTALREAAALAPPHAMA